MKNPFMSFAADDLEIFKEALECQHNASKEVVRQSAFKPSDDLTDEIARLGELTHMCALALKLKS